MGYISYLCSRFHRKSNEALYLRLADENLRNFHVTQESMTASRVLAWAVIYFSVTRYFSGPSSEEVVHGTTLLFWDK